MDAGGGQGGFPGGYGGMPGTNAAPMTSDSNINNNSVVPVGGAAPVFAPQQLTNVAAGDVDASAEPSAKRMKVEPSADSSAAAVANMAAIAASRATVGSGMSTEQFLQALPAAYSAQQQPAFMVMLQQQQQIQQQQAQRQQLLQHQQQQQQQQHQQQQLQHHIQAQKQLQLQRHLQVAGTQYPMGLQQQQQFAAPQAMTSAHANAQSQAQAIMMAAMAQNRLVQLQQQQQQQQQQRQQQVNAIVKAEPTPMAMPPAGTPSLLVSQQKKPQPVDDPVCLVCNEKSEDLFVCSYACGLAAHPRCIGEDMVISPLVGGKICASCSIMQQDRNSKENLHKGGILAISVRRAILCLNVETNAPTNFEKFGHLASLRLYEIAQVAGYPIGPFASRFIEPHLQRWVAEKLVHIASWPMSVRDVFTLMIGLYSLDRAAICHGWRNKAIELVSAKKYSTTDFLGWHPAIEGPEVRCSSLCAICCIRNPPELLHCSRCRRPLLFPTVFTKFVSALLASHYAEHVGISFGISFLDVFAHLHSVRGHYKGLKPIDPNGFEWDMFADQMRMIFGLLDIVSNFGVLELDPDLFDAEASIVFNPQYLNHAMLLLEFETVGRFLQCMKLFGKQRTEQHRAVIDNCEKFLIARQQPNGSWCKMGSSVVDQYKATVVCAKALVNPMIRGRGPANPEQRRLLIKWAKKTPGNLHAKRAEQLGQGKLLAAGVTVTGRTVPNLKKLELFYRRQIVPTSGLNSLETLATARLRAIWSIEKPEPQEEDVKDELVSATTDNEDTDAQSVKADQSDYAAAEEDESLIKLSLNGELSLFDGLKFEDGDVIDISANGEVDDDDDEEKGDGLKAEDDDVDAEERAENENGAAEEDQDEADDMYDDDDDADADADADGTSQLPEPDMANQGDEEAVTANDIDVNDEVDISALETELQLDGPYAESSMDLALDM